MVSIWWVLGAFVLGGYAGAILIGLLGMSRQDEEEPTAKLAGESLDEAAPRLSY